MGWTPPPDGTRVPQRLTAHYGHAQEEEPASHEPDELRRWALQIKARKGYNLAAVALANKLARICWRVWRDDRPFEVQPAA